MTAPFLEVLAATLPDLHLSTDGVDLEAHRRDETAYLEPPLPLAVAFPASTAEVAGIARVATTHVVPLVPRGAGTGLAGGANAVAGDIVAVAKQEAPVLDVPPLHTRCELGLKAAGSSNDQLQSWNAFA